MRPVGMCVDALTSYCPRAWYHISPTTVLITSLEAALKKKSTQLRELQKSHQASMVIMDELENDAANLKRDLEDANGLIKRQNMRIVQVPSQQNVLFDTCSESLLSPRRRSPPGKLLQFTYGIQKGTCLSLFTSWNVRPLRHPRGAEVACQRSKQRSTNHESQSSPLNSSECAPDRTSKTPRPRQPRRARR